MTSVNAIGKARAQVINLVEAALSNGEKELKILADKPGTAMDVMEFLKRRGFQVTIEDNDGTMTLAATHSTLTSLTSRPTLATPTPAPVTTLTTTSGGQQATPSPLTPSQHRPSPTMAPVTSVHSPSPSPLPNVAAPSPSLPTHSALLITGSTLGTEDPELGRILMLSFLSALVSLQAPQSQSQSEGSPEINIKAIVLVNGGVKLATFDSSACDYLKDLEAHGTKIFVSSLSAAHFGLTEDIGVGDVVNMLELARILTGAKSVITL